MVIVAQVISVRHCLSKSILITSNNQGYGGGQSGGRGGDSGYGGDSGAGGLGGDSGSGSELIPVFCWVPSSPSSKTQATVVASLEAEVETLAMAETPDLEDMVVIAAQAVSHSHIFC